MPVCEGHTAVVTGAAGFVGQRLVRVLHARGDRVVAIARSPRPADVPAAVTWIECDLLHADRYEAALRGARSVLHLAAVTGKARPDTYRRDNVEATRVLLGAAERARVGHFVLVSSIAAAFQDRRYYAYAESKLAAEALMSSAALRTTIVRPTMVLGAGSPVQSSLEKLARLPLVPLFGDGLRRVQPIPVDALCRHLADLGQSEGLPRTHALLEYGGPEVYTLRELLQRMRRQQGLSSRARFLRVPLAPLRAALAWLERPLLPVLPLTAGQLATFANDGIVKPPAEPT